MRWLCGADSQTDRQTGCQAATATASSSSQSNLRAYKREQKIVIYSTCFMPNVNENSNLFIFNIKCSRPVPNACPVTCKRVCKSQLWYKTMRFLQYFDVSYTHTHTHTRAHRAICIANWRRKIVCTYIRTQAHMDASRSWKNVSLVGACCFFLYFSSVS